MPSIFPLGTGVQTVASEFTGIEFSRSLERFNLVNLMRNAERKMLLPPQSPLSYWILNRPLNKYCILIYTLQNNYN